jgi:hypothetical protein
MTLQPRDREPRDPRPLARRTALVTGVSRRAGIGYAATACDFDTSAGSGEQVGVFDGGSPR